MKRILTMLTLGAMFVALMALSAVPSFGAQTGECSNPGCKTTTTQTPFSPSGNPNAKQNFTSTSTTSQQNSPNASKPNKPTDLGESCTRPPGQCR